MMTTRSIGPAWIFRWAPVLIATLVMLSPALAPAATFDEVAGWCSAPRVAGNDQLCGAYVAAALHLLRTPDQVLNGGHQICPPEGDMMKTVVPIITSWGKQHPEARTKDAVETIGESLAERYSCK